MEDAIERTVSDSGNRQLNLFLEVLGRAVKRSTLRFSVGEQSYDVGPPGEPNYELLVKDPSFFGRVLAHGNLGFGEAWMDEHIEMKKGPLHGLLTELAAAKLDHIVKNNPRLLVKMADLRISSVFRGRTGNVRSHYDIGDQLFESFLDETMMYSCGYAKTPDDTLIQLQRQKLQRICQKLRLKEGDRLLDIGCGFGGLLLFAAEHYGVNGFGITNATRHHAVAVERAKKAGLSDRVEFACGDFTTVIGTFDKIVSVGMLEHVPHTAYKSYFKLIADCLHPDGLGLVHCIGANSYVNEHDPFIQKYIFPGSNQPRLSEMARECERNRLPILDVENIVRHYGFTVERWLENFHANFHTLPQDKYDARFKRMWEYYFRCGIAGARASDAAVYQVLFAKDYAMDLPLARV